MNDEWVELLVTYDALEAGMVKDILEAEGLESSVQSLKISPYPVSIGRIGEVRVFVKRADETAARRILQDVKQKGEEKPE